MPTKSDIVSFDNAPIPTGVTGQLVFSTPVVDPAYEDRDGSSSAYTTTIRSPLEATVQFKWTTYAHAAALRAWLGFPEKSEPRPLVIYGGDWDSPTQVTNDATIVSVGLDDSGGGTPVTFRFADLVWHATTPTTHGPFSYTGLSTETITVLGETVVVPLVKVGWSAQRGSPNSLIGWTYAREITVTNNSTQALHNYPVQLGPINTATLVSASKLQADNDDLVVFNDRGERMRRATAGTNTRGTFVWFVVDELAAGASRTYTVAYGNSAATYTATTQGLGINYPGSPAIDTTAIDGQATAGAGSTITLAAGVTLQTDQYVGSTILLVAAGGSNQGGQYRRIASHNTATPSVVTVSRAWSTNPDTNTGYVIVGAGFMGDGGVVSGSTSTTLSDSSQAWNTNEWIGATVEIITLNTTIGAVTNSSTGTVTSNSATQLVVSGWSSGTPSTSAIYRVYKRNANWIYRTELVSRSSMNHRGRWRINTVTRRPSQMWFAADGAPASWSLTTYNTGNAAYDYNQPRATNSSSEWFAALNVRLARKDGAKLPEEGFANGVELYCPLGILGVKHDYGIQNPDGMARAVFGARERGGEDWELYHEYSTTQSSLVDRPVAYYNLTDYGMPLHLLAALTSDDDADVEKTQKSTARLREGAVLEVRVDSRTLDVTNWDDAPEYEVYDMSIRIRRGAAAEAAGDDRVLIGGDDHHLFLRGDQEVYVGPYGDWPLVTRVYRSLFTDDSETDAFTDSNGTNLESHSPTTGGTWTKHATASGAGSDTIDNNRAHNPNTSTTHVYYHDKDPVSADYDVTADVVVRSDNNLSSAGVAGRIATGADTYYAARYLTNGNVWALTKVVAGAATTLASVAATLVVDQAYELTLVMRGSWLRVLVDGVVVLNTFDADVTAAGKAGIITHEAATSTTGVHLDNWSFADAGNPTYVRDVPNQVEVWHVDDDWSGDPTWYVSSQVLPLTPGSTQLRVSDVDGTMGTTVITYSYEAAYL